MGIPGGWQDRKNSGPENISPKKYDFAKLRRMLAEAYKKEHDRGHPEGYGGPGCSYCEKEMDSR